MTTYVSDDYTGTVGAVGSAGDLSADQMVGSPSYVATGGHDGLGTAVQFDPSEYVTYFFDPDSFVSCRVWVTTPATMDGVGQDWSIFEWVDGSGNPMFRAGWNPNRRWKLYNV